MNGKQRDRPRLRDRLARWGNCWGVDVLLIAGAAAITAGVASIYPPAGAIVGGVLLIAGGVLLARGNGGGDDG